MRRFIPLAPILAVMALSACETMQGAGRDMQTAGALLTDQAANSQTQIGQQPYASPPPY
ncbi:entericidin A/B family lipoprotein [Paracoccus ravus]|uniref:entericidin A/B family lipoprotein n=1 Tax=Paracoccus ravus TaxID=2447760 RepID=UPI00106F0631|nr:entericidin A/B family lipoprotein [Paracoccus ravus]